MARVQAHTFSRSVLLTLRFSIAAPYLAIVPSTGLLDDHGARTRGAGKAAAQHRSACTPNFDGLSAQALASERGHSIPAAMRAPSLFELRTSAPASLLVASVLAASPATDADVTCSSHVGPGWVLEAPQGEQPGHVTDSTFTPFAFDHDANAHSDSGLTGPIDGDTPSCSETLSSAGAAACPPHASADNVSCSFS